MTARHYQVLSDLIAQLPAESAPELRMLREFDPQVSGSGTEEGGTIVGAPAPDVADPWYGQMKDFAETLATIERSVPGITDHLRQLSLRPR